MMKNEIENKFNCQKALWRKFSDKGKIAYGLMSKKAWETVSHNYACFAAWEF